MSLGDVALRRDPMRDAAVRPPDGRNEPLDEVGRAVLPIVDGLALVGLAGDEGGPNTVEDMPVGPGTLQKPRDRPTTSSAAYPVKRVKAGLAYSMRGPGSSSSAVVMRMASLVASMAA